MLGRGIRQQLSPQKTTKISELILCVGLLFTTIGAGKYFLAANFQQNQFAAPSGSITERRLAIGQAVRDKRSNYNFVTSFIPGIGTITNPQDYLNSWKNQLPEFD